MKKIIFLFTILLLTITQFSYSQTSTKKQTQQSYLKVLDLKKLFEIGKSIVPSVEKYNFYQHLYYAYNYDILKNSTDIETKQIKKYPDIMIREVARIVVAGYKKTVTKKQLDENDGEMVIRQTMQTLDSSLEKNDEDFYSKLKNFITEDEYEQTTVEKVNGKFVTVNRNAGIGPSMVFQYLYCDSGRVTNLKNVYNFLDKVEYKLLEATIKKKIKKYDYPSSQSGTDILKLKNGNYKISFSALKKNDPSCCPSIQVSYETKDFKIIIPNSITAK